ncbi:hypothetical protein ACFQI7_27890 [Paenibacillus allorhizosphaerae]|uniref:Uncharacterized protein n=1 Tax=Paenibacillus allorhizosphaerae TaxID=2849866 RepID=A0ABM8VNS6_9BACL|nr:hypothetical protein [Paenibacillus allorhizosphaerae]CAG7651721.1 hypothetical protein PAECIP111802_05034 [Paenibacillus allorhizosphaerae]
MPFFKIADRYAFLHIENYNKLNEIALKDKTAKWRFDSHVHGRKEANEAQKLREKTLHHLYKTSSSFVDFYCEWIHFDLSDRDLINHEVPFLLYDYGCINEFFAYRKVKEGIQEELFPDLYYDKDATYQLYLITTNKKLFGKQEQHIIFSTMINTNEIISITGELKEFIIELPTSYIICSEYLKVVQKQQVCVVKDGKTS